MLIFTSQIIIKRHVVDGIKLQSPYYYAFASALNIAPL